MKQTCRTKQSIGFKFRIHGILLFLLTASLIGNTGCLPKNTWENPHNCSNLPDYLLNLPETTEYMLVLWRPENVKMNDFTTALYNDVIPVIEAVSPSELELLIEDPSVSATIILHKRKLADGSKLSAIISLSLDSLSAAIALTDALQSTIVDQQAEISFLAGYEVSRSKPLIYTRDWPDGEQSPGVKLVTLMQQKPDIEYQEFLDFWFCGHTPLSFDVHPQWDYERNVVANSTGFTLNAPYFDGIVMEHMLNDTDLTNFSTFFGGEPLYWSMNILKDTKRFLNLKTIVVHAMREHILISNYVEP